MSEQYRTKEEYTERYAVQHCDGDCEEAAEHNIVKEVCDELKKNDCHA